MGRPIAITALPVSPSADQRRRFVMYTVTMSIRVVCVLGCLFVTGWWQLLCLVGAVVLPYIAVVIANVSRVSPREEPEAPGPLEIPRSWLD
ncbi:MAG: hypothetical protein BGO95_00460 [Micrococcales bacterium 73-13]|nr:MAG: hypothetical protein BGO95_00460 [Micrococcales bacterium 73-13]